MEINDSGKYKIIDNGTITDTKGFFASSCHCGIRKYKEDFCILYTQEESSCSVLFTKNKFAAAPVIINKEQLAKNRDIRAIVICSGIANACTGNLGLENAKQTIELASKYLNLEKNKILVASTGRIGKQLPMDKVEKGISICSKSLGQHSGHNAAKAILTIDKNPKEIAVTTKIGGTEIIIGGIAKGSVMIEPDMATTLVFISTDIKISVALLDEALKECVENTFNCISTDGCQSTNDMVMIIANGASSCEIMEKGSSFDDFKKALLFVLESLSLKVVEDGEGATKIIEINVCHAGTREEAKTIGKKIANSILFKAAMFGEDLNWGRITAAIGSVEYNLNPSIIDIFMEDIQVMEKGQAKDYDLEHANRLMKNKHIRFLIDLNSGEAKTRIFTNDISYEYIKINAEYKKQR